LLNAGEYIPGDSVAQTPPKEPSPTPKRLPRRRMKRGLMDRVLDYPYGGLFGLKGKLVIAAVVVLGLIVKFLVGINSVALDPLTCELAWTDGVYKILAPRRFKWI
jgi:hypothetical protein